MSPVNPGTDPVDVLIKRLDPGSAAARAVPSG